MTKKACLLCGHDAEEYSYHTRCSFCGEYALDGRIESECMKDDKETPLRLACILHEKKRKGFVGILSITKMDIGAEAKAESRKELAEVFTKDELLAEFPKATEMIDRGLANLASWFDHSAETKQFSWNDLQFMLFSPNHELAQTQLKFINERGLVLSGTSSSGVAVTITPEGWKRIQELEEVNKESKQGFVAMWFDGSTNKYWDEGFEPGVKDAGYDPRRIDKKPHNNKICDEIIAEIRS